MANAAPTPGALWKRPILLATDGSGIAARARDVAVDLCRRSGAPLHIVHAWGLGGMTAAVATAHPDVAREQLQRGAIGLLAQEAAAAEGEGVRVDRRHLVEDGPGASVLLAALRVRPALIVIGNRGLNAVGRAVLGTVSEDVVDRGIHPVLIVHRDSPWPPVRVVVGDDGSAAADRAGTLGAELARTLGVDVILVHGARGKTVTTGGVSPSGWLDERALRLAASSGCRVTAHVLDEDPVHAITSEAAGADGPALVVLGAHMHTALTHWSSVSTALLRRLHLPVVVVPARRVARGAPRPLAGAVAGNSQRRR